MHDRQRNFASPGSLHWCPASQCRPKELWIRWRNAASVCTSLSALHSSPTSKSEAHTSLDPMFDFHCAHLIEWPCANAEDCRSQTLRQTGNTEKINRQLYIIDTEWHHRVGTGPHTWINAYKRACTMIRHLWNLKSICCLNADLVARCPPETLWLALSSLLCPLMESRQPDKTPGWPAAVRSSQ